MSIKRRLQNKTARESFDILNNYFKGDHIEPLKVVFENYLKDIEALQEVEDATSFAPGDLPSDNITVVRSIDDLPAPSGGVISLTEADHSYQILGNVDIGTNRISLDADNIKIFSINPGADSIISSTTGPVLYANGQTVTLSNISIFALGASHLFNFENGSGKFLTITNSTGFGALRIGTIDGYDVISLMTNYFTLCTGGILFTGSLQDVLLNTTIFDNIINEGFDLNGATFDRLIISSNVSKNVNASYTFLKTASNGANINSGGLGTVFGNKVDTSSGASGSSGLSPLDLKWDVDDNLGLQTSDRKQPQGWGFYIDNAASTQLFTSTASKLEINGLGGSTTETHLPLVIRGTDSLWDTTDNCIKPITEGDDYSIRIQLDTVNLTSNPTRIECILDIGGAATPTIEIFRQGYTLRNDDTQVI
jgi:hypothetical protein